MSIFSVEGFEYVPITYMYNRVGSKWPHYPNGNVILASADRIQYVVNVSKIEAFCLVTYVRGRYKDSFENIH